MTTEAGWHTEVWSALTMAPVFDVRHSSQTADSIYTWLKDKLEKEYPVGTATVLNT